MENYDIYRLISSKGDLVDLKPHSNLYSNYITEIKNHSYTSLKHLLEKYPDNHIIQLFLLKDEANRFKNLYFLIDLNNYDLILFYCEINNVSFTEITLQLERYRYKVAKFLKELSYAEVVIKGEVYVIDFSSVYDLNYIAIFIKPFVEWMIERNLWVVNPRNRLVAFIIISTNLLESMEDDFLHPAIFDEERYYSRILTYFIQDFFAILKYAYPKEYLISTTVSLISTWNKFLILSDYERVLEDMIFSTPIEGLNEAERIVVMKTVLEEDFY